MMPQFNIPEEPGSYAAGVRGRAAMVFIPGSKTSRHRACRAAPRDSVDLRDRSQWWVFLKGANWRRPYGPDSSLDGLDGRRIGMRRSIKLTPRKLAGPGRIGQRVGGRYVACCVPSNPHGGREEGSYDPRIKIPRRVVRGGSHLCAPNYCRRNQHGARHAHPVDTSTSHIGFRCVVRQPTASEPER
jgi:Sulfatase-modifying factor enzyme 1